LLFLGVILKNLTFIPIDASSAIPTLNKNFTLILCSKCYYPFSWWAVQTLLTLKYNTSAFTRLEKTSLLLHRAYLCMYKWQHLPSTTEWLVLCSVASLVICQNSYIKCSPIKYDFYNYT
jgi:hypothetical protein